jgi:ubiquinone biosynthesis monooxygenase Coq6
LSSISGDDSKEETFDIVINGGGIVGLSLLASLSTQSAFEDKKILLLEQQSPQNTNSSKKTDLMTRMISNRVSSITTASKKFYKEIGIWSKIESSVKEVTSMYVWSEKYDRGITFSPRYPALTDFASQRDTQFADEVVCYFVENQVLLKALEETVQSNNIRYSSNVMDIQAAGEDIDVILEDGSKIRSHLLVGADGFNSVVRRKSTLKYFEHPLEETAIVGTVEMDNDVNPELEGNNITFQRFLPEDKTVIALLPITRTHSSFVISTSKAKAHMMMNLDEEEFVDAMNALLSCESQVSKAYPLLLRGVVDQVDSILSKVLQNSPSSPTEYPPEVKSLSPKSRASFPLFFGTTSPFLIASPVKSNNKKIVLIGDSCHRIPPLAGQGLNLGIGDAVELTQSLREGLERGDDIFNNNESLESALESFERRRQLKLLPMMAAVISMQRIFSLTPSSLLASFNQLSLVKNEVVKFANSK